MFKAWNDFWSAFGRIFSTLDQLAQTGERAATVVNKRNELASRKELNDLATALGIPLEGTDPIQLKEVS